MLFNSLCRPAVRFAALFAALVAVACGEGSTAPVIEPAPTLAIVFSDSQPSESDVIVAALRVNDSVSTGVPPLPVVWLVSDTSAATIDPTGRLTLRTPGTLIVTARVGARSVSRTLSVRRRVEGFPSAASHALAQVDGSPVPLLVAADTVSWDGVQEYHEVYLESGTLRYSGGEVPRYFIELRYVEFAVHNADGERRKDIRLAYRSVDHGVLSFTAAGALRFTSEFVSPLSHTAMATADGYAVQYRIGGTDEVLSLRFVRE